MPKSDPEIAQLPPRRIDGRARLVRNWADRAWLEMQRHEILPIPGNFELWYTYVSGSNPDLSTRLSALVQAGVAPTPEQLDALRTDCLASEVDLDAIADGSEQLDQAAQALVEQVAGSRAALRAYGETLSSVAGRLDQDQTVVGLVQAVTVLSAETARAAERNRALEHQLASSVARISKLRQDLFEAKQDATTDGLTGLCNRKAFDARLRRAIGRAKADHEALCLVLLDIDHFKRFNDTYGHRTGDLVLRLVGRVVADNVKGRDTAARYGGEEFAVILTGADLRAGAVVAGQMRFVLDGKRLVTKDAQQHHGSVTISAGVAQFWPGDTTVSLIERADAALYAAKHAGRNRVCVESAPRFHNVA
jgi:diguanylate cyclase